MEKIKNFLNNKLNLFAVLVILIALAFGGYKYYGNANADQTCTLNIKYYKIQKDQVVGSCSDILWGEWKKTTDGKREVREGVGIRTIVDYRKQVNDKTTTSHVACSRASTVNRSQKSGEEILNLKDDPTATIYKTNLICKVRQYRTDDKSDPITDDPTNPNDDDPTNPNDDDPTNPNDDDPTNLRDKDGFINTGIGDGDNTSNIKPAKLNLAWSTDKIHWNDFDKMALLKTNREKIYIKTVPEGGCGKSAKNFMSLTNFNFSPIKEGKKWMKHVNREEFGSGFLTTTEPTEDAKAGELFKQPFKDSYCGTEAEKELKVKIVDIVQKEI